MNVENIPGELRTPSLWLQYYFSVDPDKPNKKPRKHPVVKYSTPELRAANLKSLDYLIQNRTPTAGFQRYVDPKEGFVYFDLDKCRDAATGAVKEWASSVIDQLDSYTELSASGSGFHIVVRAKLWADFQIDGNPLEIFSGFIPNKLLALTGDVYELHHTVEERQEQAADILRRAQAKHPGAEEQTEPPAELCTGLDYVVGPNPADPDPDNFDGWFPLGAPSLIYGSTGAGKTTLMLQLLTAQEQGNTFAEHKTFKLPWVMLMMDRDDLALMRTFRRMKIDKNDIHFRQMPKHSEQADPGIVVQGMYAAESAKPRIVFIEAIDAWVKRGKESDSWVPVLRSLQEVARRCNIAIIGSMGSPKMKIDDRYDNPRDCAFGSQMVGRMTETMVHVSEDFQTGWRHVRVMPRNARAEKLTCYIEHGLMKIMVGAPEAPAPESHQGQQAGKWTMKKAFIDWWTPGATLEQARGTFGAELSKATFHRWVKIAFEQSTPPQKESQPFSESSLI